MGGEEGVNLLDWRFGDLEGKGGGGSMDLIRIINTCHGQIFLLGNTNCFYPFSPLFLISYPLASGPLAPSHRKYHHLTPLSRIPKSFSFSRLTTKSLSDYY